MAEKRPASRQKTAHRDKGKPRPRTLHRLSATFVRTVSKKGTYGDGGNLYLQVGIGGKAKSWIFIYTRARFSGDDSHERFIKALEHEHRAIPQTTRQDRDRGTKLFKIANEIVKEHERDYAAHKVAYESGERKQSELAQAAENYAEDRRARYVGLGSANGNAVSLARARELAQECRELLARKPPIDPHAEFEDRKRKRAKLNAKTKNFYEMAISYLDAQVSDPENPIDFRTRDGYEYTLNKYLPSLHKMLPAEITARDIYDVIQPLRQKGRRSTADKSRTFAQRVIEWARANEAFPEDKMNPAAMGDGSRLRVLLNTDSTTPVATPLKALHFSKIPALFAKLELIKQRSDFTVGEAGRAAGKTPHTIYNYIREGRLIAYKPDRPYSSRSMDYWLIKPEELFKVWPKVRDVIPGLPSVALHVLKFQILTAARPAEVLGMRWVEWEEDIQVWHVPWRRIKQGGRTRQDHYVPLSPEATAILEALREQQRRDGIKTEFVFGSYWTSSLTSARIGIPPAKSTVRNLLERNVDKVDVDKTLHGMRRAFSSWATRLGYQEKDIERGLSHIRGYGSTPVARIYNRDAYNSDGGNDSVMSAIDALYEDPLRELFVAWANYCFTSELPKGRVLREPAEVIPMLPRH